MANKKGELPSIMKFLGDQPQSIFVNLEKVCEYTPDFYLQQQRRKDTSFVSLGQGKIRQHLSIVCM